MQPIAVIPTGIPPIDQALGIGGVPRGCFIEIAGPESSGKTGLCLGILAGAQRQGGEAAIIDADHTLDGQYARRCGVDTGRLIVFAPASAEQALDALERLAASGALAVIALDSLTHLIPQAELDMPLGIKLDPETVQDKIDALLSLTLQRLSQVVQRTQTTLIFTRQTGAWRSPLYHGLAQHPERLALHLHAALRLELLLGQKIYRQKQVIGHKIEVKIVRNQFAPCRQSIELDIMY